MGAVPWSDAPSTTTPPVSVAGPSVPVPSPLSPPPSVSPDVVVSSSGIDDVVDDVEVDVEVDEELVVVELLVEELLVEDEDVVGSPVVVVTHSGRLAPISGAGSSGLPHRQRVTGRGPPDLPESSLSTSTAVPASRFDATGNGLP